MLATACLIAVLATAGTPETIGPAVWPSHGPAASPAGPAASPAGPAASPPAPTASGDSLRGVPIVPVVDYRSTALAAGWRDVDEVLGGTSDRWHALELVRDQADAILATLHAGRPTVGGRLVLASDADSLAADLATHRDRLAFLPADEVMPAVRAIRWGSRALFGVDRVSPDAWPLTARLPSDMGPDPSVAPDTTWTMFVGGDLGFDRQVAQVVTYEGKGVDYPFDGGTASIVGSVCCSAFGWPVPTIRQTGHTGAMRDLISSADLALANMEEPTPDHFTFHPSGVVFTGNPALLAGVRRAGIDVVSLANNHVGDGGQAGILQTIAHLDENGIAHVGAGSNLAEARRPALLTVGGVRVAILAYDSIASSYYGATATTPGSAPLTEANVRADVTAARKAGAQLVIVFPHWGVEYTRGPSAFQQRLAHVAIDAGADLVIGNHPHWVQAMEVYRGHPIWYALGNFTFDQTWSEPTLEGITLELTFRGSRLVQAWMHPHILVEGVQPNLLDPAGDGARVLDPLYEASAALLPW